MKRTGGAIHKRCYISLMMLDYSVIMSKLITENESIKRSYCIRLLQKIYWTRIRRNLNNPGNS